MAGKENSSTATAAGNLTRREKLEQIFSTVEENRRELVTRLIDEVLFLEEHLKVLRKLPFIRVNPKNSAQQAGTPAEKQYKELMQTYNNSIKILEVILRRNSVEGEDEFDKWLAEQDESAID